MPFWTLWLIKQDKVRSRLSVDKCSEAPFLNYECKYNITVSVKSPRNSKD